MRRALLLPSLLIPLLAGCKAEGPDAYGNFEADEARISAEVGGQLLFFAVNEGDQLTAGAIVGQIDTLTLTARRDELLSQRTVAQAQTTQSRAEIAVLEAQLSTAREEYDRTARLFQAQAATAQQLNRAEGEVRVLRERIVAARAQSTGAQEAIGGADARVEGLAEQLRKTRIVNPVSGTVLTTYANPGEFVQPGQPLYTIADLGTLTLRAYVSGSQLSQVRIGQKVNVRFDGAADSLMMVPGRVTWIASEAEFTPTPIQTREERTDQVYAVKIVVSNPDGRIKIGMPGEVVFDDDDSGEALAIPDPSSLPGDEPPFSASFRGMSKPPAPLHSNWTGTLDDAARLRRASDSSGFRQNDEPGESAVVVEGLGKRFGEVVALDDISLTVRSGELFGFIGPDGAGKTTLFRILTTLYLADSGAASVLGLNVEQDLWALRRRVGYMPGRFSLYPDLTVEENLEFFASVFGARIEDQYDLIAPIYGQIEPFKDRMAGALSGGMKQKLALSCALVHRPDILFLDEPTTGVDSVSRREFWDLLDQLKAGGLTIVVSTPYMDEAGRCDRVALIQKGRILQVAPPGAIGKDYPLPLLSVRADDRYRLLQSLRTFPHAYSAYPFGDELHYTDRRGEASNETVVDELRGHLVAAGFHNPLVDPIEAGIEDSFMYLMGAPEGSDEL